MAGHSKWKNIRHKKAATDSLKAKKFGKLLREISIASKESGPEINTNPRLRALIQKANEMNMPKDNYLRAIKKGFESKDGDFDPVFYEGFAPKNVAVIVETIPVNKNKIAGEMRTLFNHNGGLLGEIGSVSWMFEKCGILQIKNDCGFLIEEIIEVLIDHFIYSIDESESYIEINCKPDELYEAQNKLLKNSIKTEDSKIGYIPKNPISIDNEELKIVSEFIEKLEENEEINNIYVNLN
jgi:YebC/PmpR family DNA-binding regulatory protein